MGLSMQRWSDVLPTTGLSRLVRSLGRPGIGLDLGSHHTSCYLLREGYVRQDASLIALRHYKGRKQIERIGTQSIVLRGRTNTDIHVISPIENGVVAHFDAGSMMLHGMIRSTLGPMIQAQGFNAVVAVPTHTSLIERRAMRELLISVGAKSIHGVDSPLAAAIGCGLAVNTPCGRLMIDAGSATTEIAVISLGGLLQTQTLKTGGNSFNAAIHTHLKRTYGAVVGENTLETIKLTVSELVRSSKDDSQPVVFIASSLSSGLPLTLRIPVGELRELIQPSLEHIARAVAHVVERSPIEIVDDLMREGATLVGGSALFPDLATVITRRSGVPVNVPEKPMQSVAQGTGRLLQSRVEDGEWLVPPQDLE